MSRLTKGSGNRALSLSWTISLVLHVFIPALIWMWTTGAISAMLGTEQFDLETLDLSHLAPPEYMPEPEALKISDRSILFDHGGRDELERELFKAFAESGGLVGDRTNWTAGPKMRFGHTITRKYFSYYRSGFVGHFRTKAGLDVYILDGRNDPRFGKLLLHVPSQNFLRALTRMGSRYIYTYGTDVLEVEPSEGAVMFMGDGDLIYRFMWLPKDGKAYYPIRLNYFDE